MCMLKLVLYKPGKWHNIRAIINRIYICREMYAQIYVNVYTHYLSWLFIYIYIYISFFIYMKTHTYSYICIYTHTYMRKSDGFCNAAW